MARALHAMETSAAVPSHAHAVERELPELRDDHLAGLAQMIGVASIRTRTWSLAVALPLLAGCAVMFWQDSWLPMFAGVICSHIASVGAILTSFTSARALTREVERLGYDTATAELVVGVLRGARSPIATADSEAERARRILTGLRDDARASSAW